MPPTNSSRSASAPRAPHQAETVGMSPTATASSARGKSTPKGMESFAGTPKSRKACREPAKSTSLASPATRKTAASNTRAINRAVAINVSPPLPGEDGDLIGADNTLVYTVHEGVRLSPHEWSFAFPLLFARMLAQQEGGTVHRTHQVQRPSAFPAPLPWQQGVSESVWLTR